MPGITDRYRKFIEEKNLLRGSLQNLEFMDLEEFEMLEPIVKSGNSLPEILDKKQSSQFRDYGMKNFLFFDGSFKLEANEYLRCQIDKLGRRIRSAPRGLSRDGLGTGRWMSWDCPGTRRGQVGPRLDLSKITS